MAAFAIFLAFFSGIGVFLTACIFSILSLTESHKLEERIRAQCEESSALTNAGEVYIANLDRISTLTLLSLILFAMFAITFVLYACAAECAQIMDTAFGRMVRFGMLLIPTTVSGLAVGVAQGASFDYFRKYALPTDCMGRKSDALEIFLTVAFVCQLAYGFMIHAFRMLGHEDKSSYHLIVKPTGIPPGGGACYRQ